MEDLGPENTEGDESAAEMAQRTTPKKDTDLDQAYLDSLRENEIQAIDQFDKTILTLTSGAFGLSFVFLKDIVKPEVVTHKGWLICACISWILSLLLTLLSFYFSHLAMRHAQRRFKKGIRNEKALRGRLGTAILFLNPASGLSFMIGLTAMSVFVTTNLNDAPNPHSLGTTAAGSTTATNPAASAATNTSASTNAGSSSPPQRLSARACHHRRQLRGGQFHRG